MNERKRLSDILRATTERENLSRLWKSTAPAEERGPLPADEYTLRIVAGDLITSKRNPTPGYRLTLEVTGGGPEGRPTRVGFWVTPAGRPLTERALVKV